MEGGVKKVGIGTRAAVMLPDGNPIQVTVVFDTGDRIPRDPRAVRRNLEAVFSEMVGKVVSAAMSEITNRANASAGWDKEPPVEKWVPMVASVQDPVQAAELAALTGHPIDLLLKGRMWSNGKYQVTETEVPTVGDRPPVTHLSIRRMDRAACRDWRDFQRIKNDICGAEREAVELFPAESRLVDAANQYHLWVLPEGVFFPVGFADRDVGDATGAKASGAERARQREWADGEKPADVNADGGLDSRYVAG